MSTAARKRAIEQARSIADELTTAGPGQLVESATHSRICSLLGGKSVLVTWFNAEPASPLRTAVGKLAGHLGRIAGWSGPLGQPYKDRLPKAALEASEQIPRLCDQIERLTTVTANGSSGARKPRHDWEKLEGRAMQMIEEKRDRLGWSINHWARELKVPTSTFAESRLAKKIERLAMVEKITSMGNSDD